MRHPELWDIDFVQHAAQSRDYLAIVESVGNAIRFMETVAGTSIGELNRVEFFASHEGLHLDYEQAQTRQAPAGGKWYNLTTHFPWLGDRTRAVDGAHVEYFRGIANPIGLKVGPTMTPERTDRSGRHSESRERAGPVDVDPSLRRRPDRRVPAAAGRSGSASGANGALVLRPDARQHADDAKRRENPRLRRHPRRVERIRDSPAAGLDPRRSAFRVDRRERHRVHRRRRGLSESDLGRAYRSDVDPRLNYEQALEMALLIARPAARYNGRQ